MSVYTNDTWKHKCVLKWYIGTWVCAQMVYCSTSVCSMEYCICTAVIPWNLNHVCITISAHSALLVCPFVIPKWSANFTIKHVFTLSINHVILQCVVAGWLMYYLIVRWGGILSSLISSNIPSFLPVCKCVYVCGVVTKHSMLTINYEYLAKSTKSKIIRH